MNKKTLQPGPELDNKMADAMGWKQVTDPKIIHDTHGCRWEILGDGYDNPHEWSTTWECAGEVLEWLKINNYFVDLTISEDGTWWVEVGLFEDVSTVRAQSSTAPHAICLAVLKAREMSLL